jgi:hypothetical protein
MESPEKVAEWWVCIPGCGNSGEDAEFVSCIFMFTPGTLLVDRTSIIVANFITHSHKGSPYHHEFLGASCHHQLLNFVILQ